MALTFGTYPMPGYEVRHITTKPEGVGWNNLGKRSPSFIVLHRILGSLDGTDQYFRDPAVPALTDYGLGVSAQDGTAKAGTIYEWVDPWGTITPWASGPVSSPYGDGLKWLQHYGYYDAANKNGVSIEISGFQTTAIDAVAYRELVKLCAYWCDQFGYAYNRLTQTPQSGASAFVWHQEFTIGTGKECPFDTVMALTPQLIADVGAELQPYQTTGGPEPSPDEEEDVLADFPRSNAVIDSELVWPNYGGGKVSQAWKAYGEKTGIWNPPGQPWADPDQTGTRKVYCFEGGPCFDDQGKLIVQVK